MNYKGFDNFGKISSVFFYFCYLDRPCFWTMFDLFREAQLFLLKSFLMCNIYH